MQSHAQTTMRVNGRPVHPVIGVLRVRHALGAVRARDKVWS